MIYFVDEDVSQIGQWASILRIKGLQTKVIRDADSALEILSTCEDIELVFIDVMLAGNADKRRRYFNRAGTNEFQSTGIELLRVLVVKRPEIFPSRAIFLSQAGQTMILEQIEEALKQYDQEMKFWRKGDFVSINEFASRTQEELALRGLV